MATRSPRVRRGPAVSSWACCLLIIVSAVAVAAYAQTPDITILTPAQNELNVPVNAVITVSFNADMDSTTITHSSFTVNGGFTGRISGTIRFEGYAGQTRTAVFDPDSDFAAGEEITAVITSEIKSVQGYPLESGFIWSFRTASGNGYATFPMPDSIPAGMGHTDITAVDLNGDGDMDVAATVPNGYFSFFINSGGGEFVFQSRHETAANTRGICGTDLNMDGYPDFAAGEGSWPGGVQVVLSNGVLSYDPYVSYSVEVVPFTVTAANLDADGDLDLATDNVLVLLNIGDGTFDSAAYYPSDGGMEAVAAADLDNDGDIDLAVPGGGFGKVAVFMNEGNGILAPYVAYEAGDTPASLVAADLNADGYLDLAVANRFSADFSVLLNDGSGGFLEARDYPAPVYSHDIRAADFDGDGDLDLIVSCCWCNSVVLSLNDGNAIFSEQNDFYCEDPRGVAVADLDGDGDMDIIASDYDSFCFRLLRNSLVCGNADGLNGVNILDVSYLVNFLYRDGPAPRHMATGDADGSGEINLLDVTYLINYLYKNGPEPIC